MADKNTLSQMLESLVNGEQQKAEELFHGYVVAKSREIYEGLIEAEMKDDEDEDDEEVEEGFDDISFEANDDDMMGGDPTDDLESDLDADMDDMDDEDDMGETSEEELFQNLASIVDELQAKFDELKDDDMGDDSEFGDEEDEEDEDDEMKDSFDLETVREYVEKVPNAKMGDNGVNTKSIVAGKNDMGGTTANILRGDTANDGEVGAGSKIKGSALNDQNPKEDNAGNINVPGGKAGKSFTKKEPGHGAEKKGAAEQADSKQSLFRGRR
jgi:hypothetical protein